MAITWGLIKENRTSFMLPEFFCHESIAKAYQIALAGSSSTAPLAPYAMGAELSIVGRLARLCVFMRAYG